MKSRNDWKKSLEKKQKSLFLLGLVISLSITLMAFEWSTFDVALLTKETTLAEEPIEIEVPVEVQPEKPKRVIVQQVVFTPDFDTFQIKNYDTAMVFNIMDTSVIMDTGVISVIPDPGSGTLVIEPILEVADKMPSFPGGEVELYKYIAEHVKHTPCALETGVKGKLFTEFVVEKDGSITGVKILRGLGCGLDEMVTKVVKNMPKWEPGEQKGKPVRVKFTLPIKFELR